MCLQTVQKHIDKPTTLIEGGWKYFNGPDNNLFPHNKWNKVNKCPLDRWITAEGGDIDSGRYKAGFHVFTDEAKVRKIPGAADVRRVYFRRVTAQGVDSGIETVVAQEMYVPSQKDAWPPKEG